jgi:hypothetical protein
MTKLRKASISTAIALTVTLISMLFQVSSTLAIRSTATSLSPTLSVSSNLANRRYVASGDRAYDMGSEDARYPAMGLHTRGEMGRPRRHGR